MQPGKTAESLAKYLGTRNMPITKTYENKLAANGGWVVRFESHQLSKGVGYVNILDCGNPDAARAVVDAALTEGPINKRPGEPAPPPNRKPGYDGFVYRSFAITGDDECVGMVQMPCGRRKR